MASDAPDDAAARLRHVDRLAAVFLARAPALRFDRARTPAERAAVFRLRYEVVIERDWAAPEAMPDGLEREPEDDRAILIGGWDGERLVAAGRILYPAPACRLPVERVFDLTVEPCGRIAHIDRLCVARVQREPSHRVFAALIGRCWLEVRAAGFSACCGIHEAAMIRVFRRLGLPVTTLGPPRAYWGESRLPVLFDPAAAVPISRADATLSPVSTERPITLG